MAINFQDNEVTEGWNEILGKDAYRLILAEIADNYPDVRSLVVPYNEIDLYNTDFAMFILENPDRALDLGEKAVKNALPPTWNPAHKVNLRITGLPKDAKVDIRNLRAKNLGKLVAVEGLVRKATTVKPRMTFAHFTCARCGAEMWIPQTGMILKEPMMCNNPEGSCNKTAIKFLLDDKSSVYLDTQKVEIQENPEGLRGGAQPERLSGFLEDDLAGSITPGNRITLNGIIRSVEKPDRDKSTVFDIFIDVMSIEFEQHEYDEIQITEEDEEEILRMSKDPNLFDNIVKSISPTIYGLDEVKRAIALQLFGGCHKEMDDKTSIRGDIHILLMGDPGVAKSQLLRYMSMLAPRGIYASGKSASAAGLTAAAVKDDFGDGRWTLEAGALVLADKGLACIDELDKMTNQDRSSLHEAMESQKISVAKAGITATLQCRCSMLAAANPKYGRFDDNLPLAEQIDLPPALMSRFDMIFVLTDKPEKQRDRDITNHILSAHRRGQVRMMEEGQVIAGIDADLIRAQTSSIKPIYDIEIMRKYVAYSKRNTPVMTDDAVKIINDSYLKIRATGEGQDASVPITARQLEAFVRLSEASAKLRLSPIVTDRDANYAVELVEYYLGKIAGTDDGAFDIDKVATGIASKDRSDIRIIKDIMNTMGSMDGLTMDEIIQHATAEGVSESSVRTNVEKMHRNGDLYQAKPNGPYKVA